MLYPSLHGFVQVGAQGVGMFSDPWFTKDEWELLNPETMICATAYGRVYVVYTNDDGLQAMLCFDGPILTSVGVEASELYADVSSGELYITKADGISIWDDPLEVPMQGSWRSKDFVFPKPINIGAGKVEFDLAIEPTIRTAILAAIAAITAANAALLPTPGDPLTATLSDALGGAFADDDYGSMEYSGCNLVTPPDDPPSNVVSVSLFAGDGSLLDSKNITDTMVFRLKSGYKKDVFSVQVTSQCVTKEIRLAETPKELELG